MTQEEKQLLLKDLCARLPYHLVVNWTPTSKVSKNIESHEDSNIETWLISSAKNGMIKPYLRPMSSITEEEKHELYNIRPYFINSDDIVSGTQCNTFIQASECQDWLNKNMFDYRGLIPMGLALEATKDMYKTE